MEDGPPSFSPGSTCPLILRIPPGSQLFRLQDSHLLRCAFPHTSTSVARFSAVPTPEILLPPVWPLPLSLATTRGISFDFSSSGYLDVSVPRVPRKYLLSCELQYLLHGSSPWGFPHSDICGSMLIYNSPQLFAVSHVLRRLLMPRHSPYALVRLNFPALRCIVLQNCLSFTSQNLFGFSREKALGALFIFFHLEISLFGEIVVLPNLERP